MEKLSRDEVVSSMIVRLARSGDIALIAKRAGFDSFYIDLEHSPMTLETVSQICLVGLAAGISPFVRVPANTPEWISRTLDAGAAGIIAPHIDSAAAAQAVVDAARFPPLGKRSSAGAVPHLGFGAFSASQAYDALNAGTMVIVQFESAEAISRSDEIVALEGVDMVLIGTNDLTADMGIAGQYDDPAVSEAYATVIAACRRAGKHCGVGGLSTRPDLVEKFLRMGARYVSTGTDQAFLQSACAAKAKQVSDIAASLR
ncbi:MAG: aldolase/citrate lyase family protein [Pusillimonas sp.]